MPDRSDLFRMLKDSGSEQLPKTATGHYKFRLPNGNLFTCATSPSDVYGFNNAIRELRRQLKETHPEIAERHRSLPKNKRWNGHNPLGELLAQKLDAATAIPGSQPVPLPEAPFEIIPAPPEPEEAPTLNYHVPRRTKQYPHVRPSPPRTVTAEQIVEANRILHAQGQAAMDAYLNGCRESLITVDKTIIAERYAEPVRVEPNSNRAGAVEENAMADVLERARAEFAATVTRITTMEAEVIRLQDQMETEINRRNKLSAYIEQHEALATESVRLLSEILPPPAPVPAAPKANGKVHTMPDTRNPRSDRYPKVPFGISSVRQRVLPILHERGIDEFSATEALTVIQDLHMPEPHPTRNQLQTWLYAELGRADAKFEKVGAGKFRLRNSEQESERPEHTNTHQPEEARVS